ncbi:MBL fold metallo-hydrolase [bacterium]|nr:MBL fold metallo-hydrolase [candidate division CSSED10-310 bacterium]
MRSVSKTHRATYIGQATVYIQCIHTRIVTDPIFKRSILGFIKRKNKPVVSPENLIDLKCILISHGHLDHLSISCLKRFQPTIPIIAPKGFERLLKRSIAADIITLSPGEYTLLDDTRITALPTSHIPGRWPFQKTGESLGYLVQSEKTIYFAGDTAYFDGFQAIAKEYPNIDLAILPIGSYHPAFWRKFHMNPEDTRKCCMVIKPKRVLCIHWGTYRTSLEPSREPKEKMLQLTKNTHWESIVSVPDPGGDIEF